MRSTQGNRRFSSAHVIAVLAILALIGTLAGGAYAASKAPKNSVVSKSVKDASLTGKDIKDNGLTGADVAEGSLGKVPSATSADGVPDGAISGPKIAADAITGAKVADGSLGGADIDEASLDDPDVEYFSVRRVAGSAPFVEFLELGGLELQLGCDATGDPDLNFSQPGGYGTETDHDDAQIASRPGPLIFAGALIDTTNDTTQSWTYHWRADDSTAVLVELSLVSANAVVGTDCVVYGSATIQKS